MIDFGQIILMGIEGTNLREDEKKFIEKENIGGIILFSKNFEDPKQVLQTFIQVGDLDPGVDISDQILKISLHGSYISINI